MSWDKEAKFVLMKIQELQDSQNRMFSHMEENKEKMMVQLGQVEKQLVEIKTTMKVRAGFFGLIAGALGAFAGDLLKLVKH